MICIVISHTYIYISLYNIYIYIFVLFAWSAHAEEPEMYTTVTKGSFPSNKQHLEHIVFYPFLFTQFACTCLGLTQSLYINSRVSSAKKDR